MMRAAVGGANRLAPSIRCSMSCTAAGSGIARMYSIESLGCAGGAIVFQVVVIC